MITQHDKKFLTQLQTNNPQDFDFIVHLLENYRKDTRLGCHDVANIISLIYGNFQLLELTTPGLSENPRWLQMGDDLRYLVSAMESISYYRYSHIHSDSDYSLCSVRSCWKLPFRKNVRPGEQHLPSDRTPDAHRSSFKDSYSPDRVCFAEESRRNEHITGCDVSCQGTTQTDPYDFAHNDLRYAPAYVCKRRRCQR